MGYCHPVLPALPWLMTYYGSISFQMIQSVPIKSQHHGRQWRYTCQSAGTVMGHQAASALVSNFLNEVADIAGGLAAKTSWILCQPRHGLHNYAVCFIAFKGFLFVRHAGCCCFFSRSFACVCNVPNAWYGTMIRIDYRKSISTTLDRFLCLLMTARFPVAMERGKGPEM